jgi:hypothetical protein
MKTYTKFINIFFLAALALIALAGCQSQEKTLTGTERDTVLAFSEDKADNLLAGLNQNDYAVFSKDFDAAMLKGISEDKFGPLKQDRDSKLGAYVSREVSSVTQSGDFYAVVYKAKFEKEDEVTVRVVFQVAEPHSISGLWFNK